MFTIRRCSTAAAGSMKALLAIAGLALLAGLPGSARPVRAGHSVEIKVATLAPRNSSFMREFQRLDKRLRQQTNGGVRFKLYASGVAGDEKDVIRKMRAGQLDAAMVTSDGLGLILPEVNVLRAPGVVTNYKQLEAVQKVMLPEFDAKFEKEGFKLVAWGEAGEYRLFSREPVSQPDDIKKMRPWLQPSSPIMKEIWRAVGATPVPLGMGEVYGAVQTRMVDLVESTAIAYVALQWHMTDLAYVTEETSGVLVGAWVMNKSLFDRLEPAWQKAMLDLAAQNNQATRIATRKADRAAYKRLIKRGLKVSKFTPAGSKQMEQIRQSVRKRMAGRVYTAALLKRTQEIADAAR